MSFLKEANSPSKSSVIFGVLNKIAVLTTALVVIVSVMAFLSETFRKYVAVLTSSQLGAIGYVYYATCYKAPSSELLELIKLKQELSPKHGCIPRKIADQIKQKYESIHPYFRLETSNDGKVHLLKSGVEGHFADVKWGDILQAKANVRMTELSESDHAHEACKTDQYGSKFKKCGRELIQLKENNCVIVIAKRGGYWWEDAERHELKSEHLEYDYTGGWLRVATTSCNIFN